MDIGSSLADCLFQHVVNELYDRGIVDILIDHTIHFIFLEQIGSFLLILISRFDCFGISVILIDRQHDLTRRCDSRLDHTVADHRKVIDRQHIHRIGHCHADHIDITIIIPVRDG